MRFFYYLNTPVKLYADVSKMSRQLCSQLNCFIYDAKKEASLKHITLTKVLIDIEIFNFYLNAVESVTKSDEFFLFDFDTYQSRNSSDGILLVRDKDIISI
jgi:hypothetical protein